MIQYCIVKQKKPQFGSGRWASGWRRGRAVATFPRASKDGCGSGLIDNGHQPSSQPRSRSPNNSHCFHEHVLSWFTSYIAAMVLSLLNPARTSYLLWHRFRMPTESGARDAIAVPSVVGDELVAAYSFLIEHIVLLVWGIAVLAWVLLAIRLDGHQHPRSPFHKDIYSKKSSPYTILQLAAKRLLQSKSTRWLVSMWILFSLACLVIRYTVPIIFAPYIKIGNGAPVNPNVVFVPSLNGTDGFTDASNKNDLQIFDFYVPSALRAVGSIDSLNGTDAISPSLSTDQEIIGVDQSGGLILRIGYQYNVTGLDFGLQNFPDLVFSVEGSCTTEYGWWAGSSSDVPSYPGAYVEEYIPFNNLNDSQLVSSYDGGPRAFFYANPPDVSPTNTTWAAVISSVNRTSWFPSTDPWYETIPNPFYNSTLPLTGPYMVAPQRPVLSCWENDVWSYQGHTGSVIDLSDMPGLDLPLGLTTIFVNALGQPMIFLLGTYLQVSSLKSSVTALASVLDASSSSIYDDLQRLVFASYIATVNCLTETTLFAPANGFLNDVAPGGILLPGTGDFVIFSEDIAALSVRTLIIVPVVAVGLWIFSIALIFLPFIRSILSSLQPPEEEESDDKPKSMLSKVAAAAGVALEGALSIAKSEE